ncbi:MAG: response regulator [Gemmatimonadota bacterium]|nr:response regulator [Gemmatimonadota bacterium]MDH5759212.1 response regulator [Gemmatimonadota bacterium]
MSLRVLLVEDAFDQAFLVKNFLRPTGLFDITYSQDGDRAADLLKDKEFDILITDLNLPGVSGFELIRLARAMNPDMPVLATTGYTASTYQEQAYRAGTDDLLLKPLNRSALVSRVKSMLSHKLVVGTGNTAVLALGGLMGDVEMGCGGTLSKARAQGKEVMIIPLCRSEACSDPGAMDTARRAAGILGAKLLVEESSLTDPARRVELVERVVEDMEPEMIYVPAVEENDPVRREAVQVAQVANTYSAVVRGYQTATSGLDFRPDQFEDVSNQMKLKLEALTVYGDSESNRSDLTPHMAQVYARYWGRLSEFSEVEAFETIR